MQKSVVEALRYKLEGCGFNSQLGHLVFFFFYNLPNLGFIQHLMTFNNLVILLIVHAHHCKEKKINICQDLTPLMTKLMDSSQM
jgi:hypothetical protein